MTQSELTLSRDNYLYDALESLAEEAGVSVSYAFEAALFNLIDHADTDFVANPRAERFREQTQEEADASLMATALRPEESEQRIKSFLDTHGAALSEENRESIAGSMRSLNTHAVEMKTAWEAMMTPTNQTVH